MRRSRRRFLRLLAAGSAAAVAAPLSGAARAATPAKPHPKGATPKAAPGAPKRGAAPAPPAATAEEIRKQKANVEQALKAVRDYPLPPGSDPAFVFAPLAAGKTERES
jgi:hypothetical protein